MKHTNNYMDAMWVIENPERYDDRDVVRAIRFGLSLYAMLANVLQGYN